MLPYKFSVFLIRYAEIQIVKNIQYLLFFQREGADPSVQALRHTAGRQSYRPVQISGCHPNSPPALSQRDIPIHAGSSLQPVFNHAPDGEQIHMIRLSLGLIPPEMPASFASFIPPFQHGTPGCRCKERIRYGCPRGAGMYNHYIFPSAAQPGRKRLLLRPSHRYAVPNGTPSLIPVPASCRNSADQFLSINLKNSGIHQMKSFRQPETFLIDRCPFLVRHLSRHIQINKNTHAGLLSFPAGKHCRIILATHQVRGQGMTCNKTSVSCGTKSITCMGSAVIERKIQFFCSAALPPLSVRTSRTFPIKLLHHKHTMPHNRRAPFCESRPG